MEGIIPILEEKENPQAATEPAPKPPVIPQKPAA